MGYMMNNFGGYFFMGIGWLFYLLVLAILVLGIAALWKYINKK